MLLRSGRGGGAATAAGERDTRSHGCSLLLPLDVVALMRTSCFCRWTGPHGRHTLSSEVGRRSIGRRSRRAEPLVAASLTSFPSMLASVRCPLAVARIMVQDPGHSNSKHTNNQAWRYSLHNVLFCHMPF
ncbi:uncharacterized protein [Triticum aestivum]|uniref:uncharacterized protein isoform X5 n=1 Tax=Triticum aestivum TaxID=4565 RepID=UPI001D016D1C|nr:uncharacterized protein LOC123136254 isoform X5 [Triticum aestivum]